MLARKPDSDFERLFDVFSCEQVGSNKSETYVIHKIKVKEAQNNNLGFNYNIDNFEIII